MPPRVSLFRPFFTAALALGVAIPLQAQLASKSPFLPPQAAAQAGPTAGAPIEFRAYMSTSEGMLYRIYDPSKKAGTWVKLNERNSDFDVVIKSHDDNAGTITVEHAGKTLTLAPREAKVVSAGSAAGIAPPPPAPPANVPAAVTQAVVLNPTPADEQRRLEAVAAEVARRRALREQATQNTNPQVAQPVQPQVQPQAQPQKAPQPVNRRLAQGSSRGFGTLEAFGPRRRCAVKTDRAATTQASSRKRA
jgi:hypothetical protein